MIRRPGAGVPAPRSAVPPLAGQPRRVRSAHVFQARAEVVLEVVLDEYAPAPLFHDVDHAVFSPLKRSLVLSAATA